MTRDRARRLPQVVEASPSDRAPDYADAFEIRLHEPDEHTAEEWARACLEEAPASVRWLIRNVHRHVLRLELGPMTGPGYVHGWRIAAADREVIRLEAQSPVLGRGVIVGRGLSATRFVVTTFLFYDRPRAGRAVWSLVGPLHRWVAPLLLQRAATAFVRTADRGAV
jgi:hypothetical protein